MRNRKLEVGCASLTLPGEAQSGDRHLVKFFRNGILLAVVDGLGHGPAAAEAAELAITTLVARPQDSVITLVQRCHAELRKTRGAVMCVASLNLRDETITWLCVGNVESILFSADVNINRHYRSPVLRGGVLGSFLPPLLASVVPIRWGDTLILATDGIRSGFDRDLPAVGRSQHLADHILERHGKGTDDALVLVARYWGKKRHDQS